MTQAVLAAVNQAEAQSTWDTLLWLVAVGLVICAAVSFYRAFKLHSGEHVIWGIGFLILAALIGPGGVSLLT